MSLDYYQISPVRGQLEPYHPDSRPGWRYLQCTDTPNELKVLLPPRTAALYARLLQLERAELARGNDIIWDRVREIRHLKDRMIRKCDRISRFSLPPPSGVASPYRIVNAPPDFRLKEMERWLRANDASERSTRLALKQKLSYDPLGSVTPSTRSLHAVPNPASHVQSTPKSHHPRTPSSSKKRASISSQSTISQAPTVPEKPQHVRPPYLSPVVEEPTPSSPLPPHDFIPNPFPPAPAEENAYFEPPHTAESQLSPNQVHQALMSPRYPIADHRLPLLDPLAPPIVHTVPQLVDRPNVISPDPIPHPYRPPSGYIQPPGTLDEMHDSARHAPTIGMPQPTMQMPEPEVAPVVEPEPVHYAAPDEPGHRPPARVESVEDIEGPPHSLRRKRSNLKQNSRFSLNGSGKVVSWAMDRDWAEHMTKFDHIIYSTELAGEELRKAQDQFKSEISNAKNLRENIAVSLERLRLETERLQLEERALRDHETKLTTSFDQLLGKEATYRDKVHAVLQETKRVVVAADGKRDDQVLS